MNAPIKKTLKAIEALQTSEDYRAALDMACGALERWPDHPRLLTLRGLLIQVAGNGVSSLQDAKQFLSAASESDPKSIEPIIEMGQYLYAVEDDAGAAVRKFEAAERLAEEALVESLLGQLKCLKELHRDRDVWRCFTRLSLILANSPHKYDLGVQVEEELNEFLEERRVQPA